MAIYIEREQKNQLNSLAKLLPLSIRDQVITSETGLVYFLWKYTIESLEAIEIQKNSQLKVEEVMELIQSAKWLDFFDGSQNSEIQLMEFVKVFLSEKPTEKWTLLGDYYYDLGKMGQSYFYYAKILEIEPTIKVKCNLAMIELALGNLDKGSKELMLLYEETQDIHVLCRMVRAFCLYEIKPLDDLSMYIDEIHQASLDEDILSFLMWYYEQLKDYESIVTCFLQSKSEANRLAYLKYYIRYLLQVNQEHQIENTLQELKSTYPYEYIYAYGESYDMIERADEIVSLYQNELNQMEQQNICYHRLALELSFKLFQKQQVIQSIEFLNQVKLSLLPEEELDKYENLLVNLARVSGSHSKELEVYQKMLKRWRSMYRNFYIYALDQKWKG